MEFMFISLIVWSLESENDRVMILQNIHDSKQHIGHAHVQASTHILHNIIPILYCAQYSSHQLKSFGFLCGTNKDQLKIDDQIDFKLVRMSLNITVIKESSHTIT